MEIEFSSPEHGWMTFDVQLEGTVITHDIADTYDPFTFLVSMLDDLLKGKDPGPLLWPIEPGCIVWELKVVSNGVRFSVGTPDGRCATEVCELMSMVNTFVDALDKLASDPIWENIEETHAWSYPFPYSQLAELKRRMN